MEIRAWNTEVAAKVEAADAHVELAGNSFLRWTPSLLLIGFAIHCIWFVACPFRTPGNPYGYVADDFYYYLLIAKNMATGHGSTFNQIVPTNGYQPLWQAVLALEQRFSPTDRGTQLFVAVSSLLSTAASTWFAHKIFRSLSFNEFSSAAATIIIGWFTIRLAADGMETILVIPSMLWLAYRVRIGAFQTSRQIFGLGLISSIAILSRLDSAIFVMLLLGGHFADPGFRHKLTKANVFCYLLGLLPVAVYVASNIYWFGGLLPVSGSAKQLKEGWAPFNIVRSIRLSGAIQNLVLLFASAIAAVLTLVIRPVGLTPRERLFVIALGLTPVAYFGTLSLRSDWPVFPWYLYQLPIAIVGLLTYLKRPIQSIQFSKWFPWVILLLTSRWLVSNRNYICEPTIPDEAVAVSKFGATHQGIYAMGDRAGSVAWLLKQPVVQTEGLVMDRKFLENIRARRPLVAVLREYGVQYFVVSVNRPITHPMEVDEPREGGRHSPKMHGSFSSDPVFSYDNEDYHTVIYDLRKEPSSE